MLSERPDDEWKIVSARLRRYQRLQFERVRSSLNRAPRS
jgi:hypothetical protein